MGGFFFVWALLHQLRFCSIARVISIQAYLIWPLNHFFQLASSTSLTGCQEKKRHFILLLPQALSTGRTSQAPAKL